MNCGSLLAKRVAEACSTRFEQVGRFLGICELVLGDGLREASLEQRCPVERFLSIPRQKVYIKIEGCTFWFFERSDHSVMEEVQ